MKTFAQRLHAALEHELHKIAAGSGSLIEQHRTSILACKKAMAKLKHYISSYAFESASEEIQFFKEVKPRFYSRYIYCINVYNFLMQQPAGSSEIRRAYILMHLAELKTFFDHNRSFYAYYRAGMTQLDEAYFTRGGFDVLVELEDFEEDGQYSTSHDYKRSKLMANEAYQDYLNLELAKLHAGADDPRILLPFKPASWTAAKTDAVELIYSLKASGAVNNGNVDISELVVIWEYVFGTDLKEYYHTFSDITRRKKDVPVFLNRLKEALLRWIDGKMGL
jgi:hypothetical protein